MIGYVITLAVLVSLAAGYVAGIYSGGARLRVAREVRAMIEAEEQALARAKTLGTKIVHPAWAHGADQTLVNLRTRFHTVLHDAEFWRRSVKK